MASHPQPQEYRSNRGNVYRYDAKEKLAIDDIDAKCDAIVEAASEGCGKIYDDIKNVQIGQETLSVADSSLEPALDEVREYIKSIATAGIQPNTDMVKEQAAGVFADLQTQEDERAKADCEADNAAYAAEQAQAQANQNSNG